MKQTTKPKSPTINQRFKYYNKTDDRLFYATIIEIENRLIGFKIDDKQYEKDDLDWIIWKFEGCYNKTSIFYIEPEYNKNIVFLGGG
jgi:hypothetical protein